MTGKHSIVIYKSNRNKHTNGKHPVCLRITKRGSTKYFFLGLSASVKEWDKENGLYVRDKRINPNYERDNRYIKSFENRAQSIIDRFNIEGINWTLNQFEHELFSVDYGGSMVDYLQSHIQNLKDTKHYGNARIYKELYDILSRLFPKCDKYQFCDFDIKFVLRFELKMEQNGLCGNTRSRYHRTLRAILNKAIKEKLVTGNFYPYGLNGFCIGKIEQETKKRYLDEEALKSFKMKEGKFSWTEIARRLFLFCFSANGMSFVDAARLTSRNIIIINGKRYIEYRREKTKHSKAKAIVFEILPEIEQQLNWFEENTMLIYDALLPIISVGGYEDEKLYNHIGSRYRRISKNLKSYCKEIGVTDNISTYWSRHTFAQRLSKECGIEKVSQALGHSSLKTTQIYVDTLGVDTLSEDIRKAITI